jgi:A/G-specific adenine glycosylase
VPARERGTAVRFEDTSRWARGRVVASLARGEGLPRDVPAARLRAAVRALERDGLVVPGEDGIPRFPDFRGRVD